MAKSQKKVSASYIFFFGVLVGFSLFWFPFESEFSPASFHKNQLEGTESFFTTHLPTTAPLLHKEGFVLAYNGQTRNPHWVYHKLTPALMEKCASREECDFKPDPLIPHHLQATLQDYSDSGFDRGHLCPAADCTSKQSLSDSFCLSNIVPQNPSLNRGYWKKLENHVRDLTKTYHAVHAFSGPLYLSSKGRDGKRYVKYQVIGKNDVAVPTHLFLLLFVQKASDKMVTKGYIIPNTPIDPKTPLKKFSASVEQIEKASGTLFTHVLSMQHPEG